MFYEPKDGKAGHGLPYNPFKAIVAPRPIAWVSSLSEAGVPNLAPFSFFNGVNDIPPMIMFALAPPTPDQNKDTRANILATKEFVIHIVPYAMREAMNVTAGGYAEDVDEFERAGLTKAPSRLVSPPRIADAPIALECVYHSHSMMPGQDGPDSGYCVVFGEVIGVHLDEGIIKNGMLDLESYKPLARLGYQDYSAVFETFSIQRPK